MSKDRRAFGGRPAAALLFAAALALTTGCVHGHWELTNVRPDAGRGDVDFQTLTLQRDGSYFAQTNDTAEPVSGTYTYDHGILDLQDTRGERNTYEAKVVGRELRLQRLWEGQRLVMVYERRGR